VFDGATRVIKPRVAKLVGGLLACLMLAAPARADLPPEVSIRWSGACPRPFALEAEVSQLLGGKRPQLPVTEFEVDVDEERAGYELTLDVNSSESKAERTVQLATCQEAQDAAVLLIATAIDPDAVLRVQKPSPPPPPPPPEPPKPPRAKAPPHRWSLTLRGMFDWQSLPGPTLGPSLGGLWQDARWRAWVDLRYLPARTEKAEDVSARVDLFAGALGSAYVWAWDPFVFGPALELELGALRARGLQNDAGPWGSVQIGGLAAWRATQRFGLELSMFAGVPLWRPRLSAGDADPFYTTAPATIRLALGVRVSLGSP
jgi:hypothetical protein